MKIKIKVMYPLKDESELITASFIVQRGINGKTGVVKEDGYYFDKGGETLYLACSEVPLYWTTLVEDEPLKHDELIESVLTDNERHASRLTIDKLYKLITAAEKNERMKMKPKQTFNEWYEKFDLPPTKETVWNAALESCGIDPKEEE